MRRFLILCVSIVFFVNLIFKIVNPLLAPSQVLAQAQTNQTIISDEPLPCSLATGLGNCPTALQEVYKTEPCVTSYATFMENPLINHYWTLDADITAQGKADERARQFVYWAISKPAIDNHPSLRYIWGITSSVAMFLFILVAALFGIGLIVGQQSNFQTKIQIWPIISKIAIGLLYIVFSYAIVMFVIQLSEILMKFFIETLGGDKLFNIYFTGSISQERSYVDWVGCRDLNYKVREATQAEITLLNITNVTYYVMGCMIILRKIILWFLLFVAPFLALLMPFVFIRNIGWIWIGVFFQWVFYGPLLALFLGALAAIWKKGIPYPFDFSRVHNLVGYIYPTGINITYGGPAQIATQRLGALNNGNYVDTFAEYIITLLMLWAVTFFPWWLLRIFRDYCCDGIYAMKNILMSMYDQSHGGPGPKPPPVSTPSPTNTSTSMKIPKEIEVPVRIKLETMEDIKRTRTEDISKSLNLSMRKITDIAKFETNKQSNEMIRKNIDFLKQPTKAETPTERQKFMNIRTELFNRNVRQDTTAHQILSSISSSQIEQNTRKQELLKTVPHVVAVTQVVSYKTNVAQDKITSVNNSFAASVTSNSTMLAAISKKTSVTAPQIQTILTSYKGQSGQVPAKVISNIAKETGVAKEKVATVIKEVAKEAVEDKDTIKKIAEKENLKEEQVKQIITAQAPMVTEPEKNVEQTVTIPPSVSIEDYEEVKKMWTQQYEKGEVPVSENITSREQWVEQDIVFITNTLNKLMSADDVLKAQGVDDLGYILPIFLINNLKGEELVVYLKAKIEAAKHVKEMKEMEKEITEKLKAKGKDEEEFIELDKKEKKEEAKHMEVAQEMEIEDKPKEPATPSEKPSEPVNDQKK